jgi:hypothetical protein
MKSTSVFLKSEEENKKNKKNKDEDKGTKIQIPSSSSFYSWSRKLRYTAKVLRARHGDVHSGTTWQLHCG